MRIGPPQNFSVRQVKWSTCQQPILFLSSPLCKGSNASPKSEVLRFFVLPELFQHHSNRAPLNHGGDARS